MQILEQITPQLYALIKRDQRLKNLVMPIWQFLSNVAVWRRSLSNRSISLPPPTRICQSVQDWVNTNPTSTNQKPVSYQVIYPSHIVTRVLPKTIDATIHWKFRINQQRQLPDAFIATIPNGRVWGDGNVITPDNQLLAEVSKVISKGEYIADSAQHPIFSQEKLPPVQKISGSVAVLSSAGGTGYYHWLFDILPRLALLQKAGILFEQIDKFLVNRYISRFQIETLNSLGIPRSKIIENHWYPHIEAEQLVLPSLVGETSHMPKWACDFLRDYFSRDKTKQNQQPVRLYFNRTQVVHRRVENESEVIEFLSRLGFRNLSLETLSVAEQIELMAMAEVVVAPHGAGLSNIVFCQPGTKVIELLSPKAVNFMYWSLSNQVDLDYYYLLGEGEIPPEPIDPYANNDNILINLNSLFQVLEIAKIQ
ncbi:MAG: glycosyltransferase family 61 protein [Nostochopsis sp.]